MGLFDSVQSTFNRGVAGASRTASIVKLKAQMSEALQRRQGLAAQLGASLYDATRENPEFRAGREALYDGIAAIDAERAQCQAEIERIEAESQAAHVAATCYTCPFCGSQLGANDLFCSGCGKPMADIRAALSAQQGTVAPAPAAAWAGPTCPSCGAPLGEGDLFCTNCGHRCEPAPAPATMAAEPTPAPTATPAPGPAPAPATPAPASGSAAAPASVPEPTPAPAPAEAPATPPAPRELEPMAVEPIVPEPPLEPAFASPAPSPVPEPAPAPGPAARACPSCGQPYEEGDLFCMECGTRL